MNKNEFVLKYMDAHISEEEICRWDELSELGRFRLLRQTYLELCSLAEKQLFPALLLPEFVERYLAAAPKQAPTILKERKITPSGVAFASYP